MNKKYPNESIVPELEDHQTEVDEEIAPDLYCDDPSTGKVIHATLSSEITRREIEQVQEVIKEAKTLEEAVNETPETDTPSESSPEDTGGEEFWTIDPGDWAADDIRAEITPENGSKYDIDDIIAQERDGKNRPTVISYLEGCRQIKLS